MILSYSFLIAAVFLTGTAHCDDKNVRRLLADDGVLTESDKESLLDMHNKQRSDTALGKTGTQPMATDMVKLIWDQDIADGAKAWADNCEWKHDESGYGENLHTAASSGDNVDNIDKLLQGVQNWYNEHSDYDYDNIKCKNGKACGHYTQNVWASTKKVGCGYATACDFFGSYDFETFLVCRYDPPGNWRGEHPYTKASTSNGVASACPSGYDPDSTTGLCILPTPGESCEELSKKQCKQVKDTCAYGASKLVGDCVPKKGKYEHDCSQYGERDCWGNDDNKGLCTVKDGVCAHVCDDLAKSPCKKFKNTNDNKKTCKAPKVKNPCKGCMPKDCGAD